MSEIQGLELLFDVTLYAYVTTSFGTLRFQPLKSSDTPLRFDPKRTDGSTGLANNRRKAHPCSAFAVRTVEERFRCMVG